MLSSLRAPRARSRRRSVLAVALLMTCLVPAATSVAAAEPPAAVQPAQAADEVLVRYRADSTRAERAQVARAHGLTAVRTSRDGRTQVVIAEGRSPATARRELKGDRLVQAVADNHRRQLADEITAEDFFSGLWGLNNTGQRLDGERIQTGTADIDIDGLEALRIERGSPDVVVAVIDDGVDLSHPDLETQAWTNPGESGANADNGIDDDDNGYIDDVHGWDFCNDDNTLSDPGEDGHGTHVAGTIAGSLNGTGIVGVAPGIKIMALKFIDDSDPQVCGADDMAVEAIDYAASFGVPIINASWGSFSPSTVVDAAIGDSGALFVAAAGNGHPITSVGINLDAGGLQFYPASSTLPNVMSVAAIDQTGRLASFSNYGKISVDISAPGTNVLSALPDQPAAGGEPACNPCWAWIAGTSMAAPHVAGVAALALSVMGGSPTTAQLRARVLGSGAPLAATVGKTVTGRLVNAWRAVDVSGPVATPINRHSIVLGSTIGSTVSTTMSWPAATDELSGVKSYWVKRSQNGGAWVTLASTVTARSYKRTMPFGTPTRFALFARDGAGNLGEPAIGPTVTASLLQDGTSVAKYTGTWSTVALSSASNGKLHRSTRNGAAVEFRTTARAIAVVGRRGPLNGKARVYVDGVYTGTIDLRRSSWTSKVVVFQTSWASTAPHSVKLVVVGGTGRVEVDAFALLR